MSETSEFDEPSARAEEARSTGRVQCPNCCRMATVVRREMGLLFYECELCLTVGAIPEPPGRDDPPVEVC
jgi:hypothetical protein